MKSTTFGSRKIGLEVEGPREASILDQSLPSYWFRTRKIRERLRDADDLDAWPITIEVGRRALELAKTRITARADGLQRARDLLQFEVGGSDPFVDSLRDTAKDISEALQAEDT